MGTVMKRMLLGLLVASNVFAGAKTPSEWGGITVDVNADHPVEVSRKIKKQDGFHRLEISLANNGDETLTISNIEIKVPLIESITDERPFLPLWTKSL